MFKIVSLEELSSLYSVDGQPRYQSIIKEFTSRFQHLPSFIARAPGRVNIIGEHIDYQGYGVLPAAIEKDCLIAVRTTSQESIHIHHYHHSVYSSVVISNSRDEPLPQMHQAYLKYFKAGYRAGTKFVQPNQKLVGLEILIEGNIPTAAGLSSSSAFCVCVALAAFEANCPEKIMDKSSFIQSVIAHERETGTASGGMDQSISILGQRSCCLYIEFNPIRSSKVHIPPGYKFIIMNSLVESAKLETAVFRYNKRVCECRLALLILSNKLAIIHSEKNHWKILKQLQEFIGLPLHNASSLVESFLPKIVYTKQLIEGTLGQSIEEILFDIPLFKDVIAHNKTYRLFQAAKHVFQEANRVISFQEVCNANLNNQSKAELLGKLMNQSQNSCRDLYECSCQQIDELTALARKNGAFGSRLTGAGWGGCTVSLVKASQAQEFIEKMKKEYYFSKEELNEKISKTGIENIIFETEPSEGACIVRL